MGGINYLSYKSWDDPPSTYQKNMVVPLPNSPFLWLINGGYQPQTTPVLPPQLDGLSFSTTEKIAKSTKTTMVISRGKVHLKGVTKYTWIFQVCKITAFSPEKPTKRQKFYIFGRPRYVRLSLYKNIYIYIIHTYTPGQLTNGTQSHGELVQMVLFSL